MRQKILIIIPDSINLVEIPKQRILESFLKEIATCRSQTEYHVCEDILRELDNVECIQVYEDNTVRLHLKAKDHFSSKTSIVIEEYVYGATLFEILSKLLP